MCAKISETITEIKQNNSSRAETYKYLTKTEKTRTISAFRDTKNQ